LQKSSSKVLSRTLVVALVAATGVLFYFDRTETVSAAAHQTPDFAACSEPEENPKASIPSCTTQLEDPNFASENKSEILVFRGRAHLELDSYNAALADFELAAALDASSFSPWHWKSYTLRAMEEPERALEAIETANGIAPTQIFGAKTKFELLSELKRYREAEDYYMGHIEELDAARRPDLVWLFRGLGDLRLNRTQDYASATEALGVALTHDPKHEKTKRQFFEACRRAGSDCPLAMPKPDLAADPHTCDRVLVDFVTRNPAYAETLGIDPKAVPEYEVLPNKQTFSVAAYSLYVGIALQFEQSPSAASATLLKDMAPLVDCALLDFPEGILVGGKPFTTNGPMFGAAYRENLINLAYLMYD